jgi:hypothetical protein
MAAADCSKLLTWIVLLEAHPQQRSDATVPAEPMRMHARRWL